MKATEIMIAWKPVGRGGNGHEIEVGPWPDTTGWYGGNDVNNRKSG
jgi:hypothetical protein